MKMHLGRTVTGLQYWHKIVMLGGWVERELEILRFQEHFDYGKNYMNIPLAVEEPTFVLGSLGKIKTFSSFCSSLYL